MIRLTTLFAAAACVTAATAGDLNPPAGPVGPTMLPLDVIEPRIPIYSADMPLIISSPGNYFLAENISTPGEGIKIQTNGVVIDLNGMRLTAFGGDGIECQFDPPMFGQHSVIVRNGRVANCGGHGIFAANPSGVLIEAVVANDNSGIGIWVGTCGVLRNCTSYSNDGHGFASGVGAALENCAARQNGVDGFHLSAGTTVRGCSASNNLQDGFELDRGCLAVDCVAMDNQQVGFRFNEEDGAAMTCVARNNLLDGFRCVDGSSFANCTSNDNNDHGFHLSGTGNSVRNGVATDNENNGIYAPGAGNTIANCTAEGNLFSGIYVGSDSFVTGNHCTNHVNLAGIEVASVRNRIDGNHCTANRFGIVVAGIDNLVARNSASANTSNNYDIAANNYVGPMIGLSITTNTNPHANYDY